jgi:hypothetical protein
MKSGSTVVLDDGTTTPTRRQLVRSSLICHPKKGLVMPENYADWTGRAASNAEKQALILLAAKATMLLYWLKSIGLGHTIKASARSSVILELAITVFDDYDDIVDKTSEAWNFFANYPSRIASVTARPWATVSP